VSRVGGISKINKNKIKQLEDYRAPHLTYSVICERLGAGSVSTQSTTQTLTVRKLP
jgi:hypothetical protein